MSKAFKGLANGVLSDRARTARVDEYKHAIRDAVSLSEVREALDVTQREVAEVMKVTQANISRIEHQDDLYVSTLAGYVAALGGRLEVTAVFPERSFALDVPTLRDSALS